jgi:hypothetical protein
MANSFCCFINVDDFCAIYMFKLDTFFKSQQGIFLTNNMQNAEFKPPETGRGRTSRQQLGVSLLGESPCAAVAN